MDLKVFIIWLVKVLKNVILSKGNSWFLISNSSEGVLVLLQPQTDCKDSCLKQISMDVDQKWKFLQQTKSHKEEFPVGWERLSCLQCVFLINGWSHERSTKKMVLFKSKKDYDSDIFPIINVNYQNTTIISFGGC